MKVHIGVDADTGVVHSFSKTAANGHDVTEAHRLSHGGAKLDIRGSASGRRIRVGRWTGRSRWVRGSAGGEGEGIGESQEPAPDTDRGWERPFLKLKRLFGYVKSLPRCRTGYATGGWPRTRSGWRCCRDWATC